MSNERHETVDDIVKEIRGNAEHNHALGEVSKYLTEIADRIEAAHKRELESTVEKSSAVGNAAAMREALMEASIALSSATHHHMTEDDAKECLAVVNAALSAPPRNCDFGTAEEQEKRFHSFCKTHLSGTRSICSAQCPCVGCRSMFHCLTKWSQMQYEEAK